MCSQYLLGTRTMNNSSLKQRTSFNYLPTILRVFKCCYFNAGESTEAHLVFLQETVSNQTIYPDGARGKIFEPASENFEKVRCEGLEPPTR